MNAHALLTSQGWRGVGNSLHPTDNAIGLSRPLLVSKKDNTLGVGKKQHKTSDMWWMNAFDKSLQGLDTSKEGTVVQTLTTGGLDVVKRGGGKWVLEKGGLYGSFVRGEGLSGTLTPEEGTETVEKKVAKKRKREGETEDDRKARKAAKKASRKDASAVQESVSELPESKEERRARKETKRKLGESQSTSVPQTELVDSADKVESKEERRARRAAKKAEQNETVATHGCPESEHADVEIASIETKEERKERRRLKKLARSVQHATTEDLSEKAKKKKRRKA